MRYSSSLDHQTNQPAGPLFEGQSPFNAGGLIYLPHLSDIAAHPHVHMDTDKIESAMPPSVTVELGEKCDKHSQIITESVQDAIYPWMTSFISDEKSSGWHNMLFKDFLTNFSRSNFTIYEWVRLFICKILKFRKFIFRDNFVLCTVHIYLLGLDSDFLCLQLTSE